MASIGGDTNTLVRRFMSRKRKRTPADLKYPRQGQGESAKFKRFGSKPPPRYQGGETGPPIPGLGQVQQERIKRANERYFSQQQARSDRSVNPRDKYSTPDKRNYRPRRRRPTLN